jgi:hypothetical protein
MLDSTILMMEFIIYTLSPCLEPKPYISNDDDRQNDQDTGRERIGTLSARRYQGCKDVAERSLNL